MWPTIYYHNTNLCVFCFLFRKLCIEFYKAIDPHLEFHYYWGDHEKTLYNILLNLNDPRTKRSATGPKYRKKKQKVTIKEEKEDSVIEEDEHSKDATEEDEEEDQMETSTNMDEEVVSSSMQQAVEQAVEMPPIPISVTPAAVIDETQQTVGTTVTVATPVTASTSSSGQVIVTSAGGNVVQQASTEDIIAAELLRQIEASLQAGVAVVTVTESSQSDASGQSEQK